MGEYKTPKMLLVDLSEEEKKILEDEGFDIQTGSFGQKYAADPGEAGVLNGNLPNIIENDLIIINLLNDKILDRSPKNGEYKGSRRKIYCVPDDQNYFNPVPLYASIYKREFEKMLEAGGVMIIFTEPPVSEVYKTMESHVGIPETKEINNYDWIPRDDYLGVKNCPNGEEIYSYFKIEDLAEEILKGCEKEVEYNCKFDGDILPLFENKLDEVVSCIYLKENEEKNGMIIFLPQFEDKAIPLLNIFKSFLPELRPDLFPDFVNDSWLEEKKYMFPNTKKLVQKKEEVIAKYEEKIEKLNRKIEKSREEYDFLKNILISEGYGKFLEENIFKVLKEIGYEKVVKVDEIIEGKKEEDLRILDNGRFTVIEIKGHKGNPTEADCQALNKYLTRNMRREDRTDIHGILIVNHERMLPPLERKKPAFTEAQITDAKDQGYTLVSTWQLFQTVRLMDENLITFSELDHELHTPGLFKAIPSNWSNIGEIEKLYKDGTVVCIYLAAERLSSENTLIIQDGNKYFKENIKEMRVDDEPVEIAEEGQAVSLKIETSISKTANIYVR